MQFGVGVIGATGSIGTRYREGLRASPDQARIVALCARRRDRLETAAQQDGAAYITDDWRALVDHQDVNLVAILTPDALHYEIAMACAEQGKHVLCEKPIATNAREAEAIWSVFRSAGLGHFVPFWLRYMPAMVKARELVVEGVLGEIRGVMSRLLDAHFPTTPHTWRNDAIQSAAGTLGDLGSHQCDLVRWVTGLEATRVVAHAAVLMPPRPDVGPLDAAEAMEWARLHAGGSIEGIERRPSTAFDYGAVAADFAGGAVGVFQMSQGPFGQHGSMWELELHGTDASLLAMHDGSKVTLQRTGSEPEQIEIGLQPGWAQPIDALFAAHVLPAIRARAAGQASDEPGLEDGWRAQLFVDAAAASARGGTWATVGAADA